MRAMWKGSLAFGLVNVPVKVYAATEDRDVRFHQVHLVDGGRISMVRRCQVCGEEVAYKDLGKAYETEDGRSVVMSDEDFENLPVPGSHELDVVEFVPSDQIDPVLFDRSYYLEPEQSALKPYVLLREALQRTDRTAVLKVVLRKRTQLAALRVRGDVMILQTMRWPDEVRTAAFDVLDEKVQLKDSESAMADMLVESLAHDFDPDEFTDEYREALLAVIEAKVAGGEASEPAAAPAAAGGDAAVIDLMTALRASVERSRAAREAGESPADTAEPEAEPVTATKATPARTAAKKAPAQKAAAKKTPAKKSA
jgi:DNA end-binding protein Ku